jgi:DNA-binding ferritin-like protein (Dps family)
MTVELDDRCMLQLGIPKNLKVDVCETHLLNVVMMFQNEAADQKKVKDVVANDINLFSSAWR